MAFVHTLASCRITPPSWRIRFSLLQRRVLTRAREEFLADSCSQRLESRFRREIFARRNLEEKGPLRSLTKFRYSVNPVLCFKLLCEFWDRGKTDRGSKENRKGIVDES